VQTPQALTAILQDRGTNIALLNIDGEYQHAPIYFYDRNPAGMSLDFNNFPEQKADFMRYAVQLNCINPTRDVTNNLLPPLEEIVRDVSIYLQNVVKTRTQSRCDLDTSLVAYGEDFVRRIPAFFRLIPYTPVPPTAIAASGHRRLRPTIYELLTSLIEGHHSYLPPTGRA